MFAVINIPEFCLQAALRHTPELRSRPVALTDPELAGKEIFQLNPAARSRGVVRGLTASQALARCADLTIKNRARPQEAAATEVLLQTAGAFSPNIEASAQGICTLDLKGLQIADSQKWASGILAALSRFHLEARVGIAVTPGLALLAARMADPILCIGDAAAFVSTLPIEALEPPSEMLELLGRWGIRMTGEFLALGKDPIAERLGPPALELFERVSPTAIRPLKLVSPPAEFVEQMDFEHEIETTEPLLFVLRRFVEQLSQRLEMIYRVVAELHLHLDLASGAAYERAFKIPSPTGSVETLFRTLQTHLDEVRTDSPIVSLRLRAMPADRDNHQMGLFEVTLRNPNQFAETLARLTALCGSDRVGSPVLEATHRADAFQLKTPDFNTAPSAPAQTSPAHGLQLRRCRPAIAATVEFRQRQPVLIRSRICRGVIKDFHGPFLSSGQWWDDARWAREEWDIQTDDGGLYRIAFSGEGCFVEGVYD